MTGVKADATLIPDTHQHQQNHKDMLTTNNRLTEALGETTPYTIHNSFQAIQFLILTSDLGKGRANKSVSIQCKFIWFIKNC